MVQKEQKNSNKLNKAVLAPFGLEDASDDISNYSKALSTARREGTEVGELVEKIQVREVEELRLEGAEEISEKGSSKGFDF